VGFDVAPEREDRTVDTGGEALRCVACDHPITEEAYRTEIAGAHEHTFVNAAGFVHRIGCFVAAPGCRHVGDSESAFSWFPGFRWQIATCARCRAHLGWIFRCPPEQFHGLRLVALRRG